VESFVVPDESVVDGVCILELGDVVSVPDEPEFLLPLHATTQTANAAIVITHFTFFIRKILFYRYKTMPE
jgi:hypothetical protein